MTGLNAASAFLLLSLGAVGSTCQRQSSGGAGETAAKDAPATATQGDVSLQGVDTSMLTPREKREWSSHVSTLMAPCSDTPVSVAQCVQEKRSCSKCLPAAKLVLRAVRDGMSQEQVEKTYHNRFDADRVKNVPLDGSPAKGPTDAPVVLVEFADFECPFCAMEAPVLEKTWQAHQGNLRFVYKFFPLSAHPHGESAARAAIAAGNQGKFWEMHDMLFANRDHLEAADIDGYAKSLGMDVSKMHTDMQSQATTDRIDRDKKLGESVGVQGTPSIFVNGREFDPRQDIEEWLSFEGAASAPAPSASAATSASAAPAGSGKNTVSKK
jgi:protein-disulfide isomerase